MPAEGIGKNPVLVLEPAVAADGRVLHRRERPAQLRPERPRDLCPVKPCTTSVPPDPLPQAGERKDARDAAEGCLSIVFVVGERCVCALATPARVLLPPLGIRRVFCLALFVRWRPLAYWRIACASFAGA